MNRYATVDDMYNYVHSTEVNSNLLPTDIDFQFWTELKTDIASYDILFRRLYKSFRYFDQEVCNDEELSDITARFKNDLHIHLIANRKRYEELYRVYVMTDTDYSITDNIDYTKTISSNIGDIGTFTSGQRQDSQTDTLGSQTNTTENEVSAFDNTEYSPESKSTDTIGQQQNGSSRTKGEEIDTSAKQRTETGTITFKGKDNDTPTSSLLKSHIKVWSTYEFYTYIFNDMCRELLLV